mgnify:CR=1 FL=1
MVKLNTYKPNMNNRLVVLGTRWIMTPRRNIMKSFSYPHVDVVQYFMANSSIGTAHQHKFLWVVSRVTNSPLFEPLFS